MFSFIHSDVSPDVSLEVKVTADQMKHTLNSS